MGKRKKYEISKKNKNITIDQNEFGILSLIKEGLLGTCTHLMNEKKSMKSLNQENLKEKAFPIP